MSDRNVQMLKAPNFRDRYSAYEEILRRRRDCIDAMLEIARTSTDDDAYGARSLAIQALGEFRAGQAVPFLAEQIDFLPVGAEEEERKPTQFYYPAVRALVYIGHASFARVLEEIEVATSVNRRELLAWVLFEVEGRSHAVLRLREAAEGGTGTGQERLLAMADYLAAYEQTFDPPPRR